MNPVAGLTFTAHEIAKALGISPRAIRLRAGAEGWTYFKESARGGLRHRYLLEGLPLDVSTKALCWRAAEAAGPDTGWTPVFEYDPEELWKRAARCTARHREEGEFRARILREVEALRRGKGLSFVRAARRVADENGRSFSAVRSWHYGRKVNGRRRRGAKDFAPEDRAAALIPRHAEAGRPRKQFSAENGRLFNSLHLHERRPSVADSYRRVVEVAKANGQANEMPSLRTIQSWVKKDIPGDVLDLTRKGPRAVVAKVPKLRIDRSGVRVGQAVSGDGLVLDRIRVDFGDGEVRSPVAWVFQDEKSGFVPAYAIGKTESATLLRHAVQEIASEFLPERMTLDNTMSAACKEMTAGAKGRKRFKDLPDDPPGTLTRLGIEVHFTNPARDTMNPGAKRIERLYGRGGLHDEVQQHPRIRDLGRSKDRPVPLAEFEAAFAEAVQSVNRRRGRRGLGCDGRSYEQLFREGLEEHADVLRKPNPYQLEMLRRAPRRVRVRKDTWEVRIRIGKGARGLHRYADQALEPWMGRRVDVLFNPDDMAEDALIEDPEGRRICRARHLADAAYGSREAARKSERLKRKKLKLAREQARTQDLMNGEEVASFFPQEAVDPSPQPKVLTADFDMPEKETAADGGAQNLLPSRGFLDEAELKQGLDLYEKQRKESRRKGGMSGESSLLDQLLWNEEMQKLDFDLYKEQRKRKRRGGRDE